MSTLGVLRQRGLRRWSATVAVIALTNGVAGCAIPPRLNHLHSDYDQKLMDTAVANFKAFTDDSGVYAQRRKNLQAEREFRRSIASKLVFNTDARNLNEFYSREWQWLP